VSVNFVDRDVDPPQSVTVGAIVFDQDNVDNAPQVLNPLDFRTVALLKRYIDGLWAEHQDLSARVST